MFMLEYRASLDSFFKNKLFYLYLSLPPILSPILFLLIVLFFYV